MIHTLYYLNLLFFISLLYLVCTADKLEGGEDTSLPVEHSSATDTSPPSTGKALMLCYAKEPFIENMCTAIKEKLANYKNCRHDVEIIKNMPPRRVNRKLARGRYPKHMPVFIVGHGNDFDGEHRIGYTRDVPQPASSGKKGKKSRPKKGVIGKSQTYPTSNLIKAIQRHTDEANIWTVSCHSGSLSKQFERVGATCASWETTPVQPGYRAIFHVPGERIDRGTKKILELLCNPELFETRNKLAKDDKLDAREINLHFQEICTEHTSRYRTSDFQRLAELRDRIERELNRDSLYLEMNIPTDPDSQPTVDQMALWQLRVERPCLMVTTSGGKKKQYFAPVLGSYEIYPAKPKATYPHATRRKKRRVHRR